MRFRRFRFQEGPFDFRFYGPMGFGGLGFGPGFDDRPGDRRRRQLRWLRRYKEDLEDELREVDTRLQELEREETPSEARSTSEASASSDIDE
jgi:hypothetical protein